MNLYTTNVKNIADEICGEEVNVNFVNSAIRKLKKMVRENADINENELDNFEYLAALMAIRDKLRVENALSPEEINAGKLKLKSNLTTKELNMLITEEMNYLSETLRIPGFCFMEVLV